MQKILIEQLIMADLFNTITDTAEKVNDSMGDMILAVCIVAFAIGAVLMGTINKTLGKTVMIGSAVAYALYLIAPTLFETLKSFLG